MGGKVRLVNHRIFNREVAVSNLTTVLIWFTNSASIVRMIHYEPLIPSGQYLYAVARGSKISHAWGNVMDSLMPDTGKVL